MPRDRVKLAQTGKVDYFNTQGSQPRDFLAGAQHGGDGLPVAPFPPGKRRPPAAFRLCRRTASTTSTPPPAIEEGHLDLVGLTRMHIADPA
jgi:hypothetical protein